VKTLRNSSIIIAAVAALALLVATPVALAGTVTVYGTPAENDSTSIAATTNISIAGFYSAPGIVASDTLTSVEIILSGQGSTIFDAYVSAIPGPPPVISPGTADISNFYTNAEYSLTGVSPTLDLYLSGTVATPGLTLTSGSPVYYSSSMSIPRGSVNATYTDPTDLADYSISGDLAFVLNGSASSNANATNITDDYNVTAGGATDAGATVEVIYNYDGTPVVPEPGTLSLFGTGLLGLAGMLRSRFSKSS
jgi:hypothetical protein